MEVLRGLLEAGVEVPLVLSQPDRPAGRKRVLTPPPVAAFAREHKLPLLQPERAGEALSALEALEPAAIAICAYGQLLPDELLALCPWLNLHPSLLPRWRGAAPIERMLMAGDAQTGVAIMQTVAELDAGPLISLDPIVVANDADTETIEQEALRLGYVLDVVSSDDLLPAAMELAATIAAGSPHSLGLIKSLVHQGLTAPVGEHMERHTAAMSACFKSDDHREGVASFLERRPTNFTGH